MGLHTLIETYRRSRRWIFLGLIVVALFLIGYRQLANYSENTVLIIPDDQLLELVPGAVRIQPNGALYLLLDPTGQTIGAAFLTTKTKPKVRGYSGEIATLVSLSKEGKISSIEVLRHEETPYYYSFLSADNFFNLFNEVSLTEATNIDSVSGATITSEAIRNDVVLGAAYANEVAWNMKPPVVVAELGFKVPTLEIGLTVVMVVFALLAYRQRKTTSWLKYACWSLSFVLVGLLFNAPISIADIFYLLDLRLPQVGAGLILVFFAIISAPLFGRLYCNYCCPFGVLQELVYRLGKVRPKFSANTLLLISDVRYLLLIGLIVLVFGCDLRAYAAFEPYTTLFSWNGSLLIWSYILLVLFFSVFLKRFWCRLLCPTGACLDLFALTGSRWRKDIERPEQ